VLVQCRVYIVANTSSVFIVSSEVMILEFSDLPQLPQVSIVLDMLPALVARGADIAVLALEVAGEPAGAAHVVEPVVVRGGDVLSLAETVVVVVAARHETVHVVSSVQAHVLLVLLLQVVVGAARALA